MDNNAASKTEKVIKKVILKQVLCPRHPNQDVEGIILQGFEDGGVIQFHVVLQNHKQFWITAQQAIDWIKSYEKNHGNTKTIKKVNEDC